MFLMALRLSQLYEQGRMTHEQARSVDRCSLLSHL